MPPLLQRLLSVRIRLRIVLRHLQFIGVEFHYFRAGACSLALEVIHKHSHARSCRRFAEIALIGPVAILFDFDRSSYLQEPIDKFPVIALARCRQTPVVFSKNCCELLHAMADAPLQRPLLGATVFFVVVRIVRATGTIDFSLQAANFLFLQIDMRGHLNNVGVVLVKVRDLTRPRIDADNLRDGCRDHPDRSKSLEHVFSIGSKGLSM